MLPTMRAASVMAPDEVRSLVLCGKFYGSVTEP